MQKSDSKRVGTAATRGGFPNAACLPPRLCRRRRRSHQLNHVRLSDAVCLWARIRGSHVTRYTFFPPFNMTRQVAQESIELSKCHILHNMTLWPQMASYVQNTN